MTRWIVVAVVVCLGVATAACSTTPTSVGSGSSAPTTTSIPLGPWQGMLTTVEPPGGIQTLRAVACPSATRCWAVGTTQASTAGPGTAAIVTTTDGGARWRTQTVPTTVAYLSAVSCAGSRACTAVGQAGADGTGPGAVLTTIDAGSTWALDSVPAGTTDVTAVDCRVDGRCVALADVAGRVTALTSASTGAPWVAGGALPPQLTSGTALSCTDDVMCWATGTVSVDIDHVSGALAATADGGATWSLQTVPTGIGPLDGVSCSSAPVPSGSGTSGSGSSTSTTPGAADSCTAVGTTATVADGARTGQGVVLTTTDGGVTWVSAPVKPVSADLLSVSCGAGPCVAVGSSVAGGQQSGVIVLTSTSSGSPDPWRTSVAVPVPLPFAGVDCRSLSTCVMVGESSIAYLAGS